MVRNLLLLLLVLAPFSTEAACKAIPRGGKYAIDWSLHDADGNLVGFGTGLNVYPNGSDRSGSATGNGLGTSTYLDGTTSGQFSWTITISNFSLSNCTGSSSIFVGGNLFHSGTFSSSDNGAESTYIGVFADPTQVRGATTIRVRSRLQ